MFRELPYRRLVTAIFLGLLSLFLFTAFELSKYQDTGKVEILYGANERSGKWETVRNHFVKAHPYCACCGSDSNLNVHHITPFHENPALELDTTNLISLCRNCHFRIGHRSNWKTSNPDVVSDCDRIFNSLHPNTKRDWK